MQPTDIAMTKQILKLQKTFVQNSIKAFALWGAQGERMARTCLEQAGLMPDEARKTWENGTELLNSNRQALENMVDAQFDAIAGLVSPARIRLSTGPSGRKP